MGSLTEDTEGTDVIWKNGFCGGLHPYVGSGPSGLWGGSHQSGQSLGRFLFLRILRDLCVLRASLFSLPLKDR
jgi:hypothetical protein